MDTLVGCCLMMHIFVLLLSFAAAAARIETDNRFCAQACLKDSNTNVALQALALLNAAAMAIGPLIERHAKVCL